MPTYNSKCHECDKVHTYIAPISKYNTAMPTCCGVQTRKVILSPPQGYVQGACEYRCPVTKQNITSWKQRKESFARNDLIDANDIGMADLGEKKRIEEEMKNVEGVVTFGDDKDMEKKINQLGKNK